MTCDCGKPATHQTLIGLCVHDLCDDCYAVEFPERAATFELARRAPNAGEFHNAGVL